MKSIKNFIFVFLLATLSLTSCEDTARSGRFSKEALEIINKIGGDYSMISATWSHTIDLSDSGQPTCDILQQLEAYGWMGWQNDKSPGEAEPTSALHRSHVAIPQKPNTLAQIDLAVPYSAPNEMHMDRPERDDRCSIELLRYQFRYVVASNGEITYYVRDINGDSAHRKLSNVKAEFDEAGCIVFEADTSLYDWSISGWQDGHMVLIFAHN